MSADEDATRKIRRMWVQGIIANYSSTNVNGAHTVARVEEFDGYTEIDIMSIFPFMQYVAALGDQVAQAIGNEACKITVRIEVPTWNGPAS